MGQVVVGIVLVLDVGLDSRIGAACGAGAHNGGVHATGLFPVDEIGHRADEVVVTDNQQVAFLVNGSVFGAAFLIVDEVTLIDALEVGIQLHRASVAGRDNISAMVVHLVHFHRHVVIHAKGFGDGVIGKGINHDVLSTEVTDDVWLIETDIAGREESVLAIALAVCVRHCGWVDATREVAL